MNLNPPRLSRLFSSNPITIPSDGYGLVIPFTYVAFATLIVHNGRILDYPEVDTSSGSTLGFASDFYLRTTDSLRAINVAAFTTVMTQDNAPVGTISAYAGNTTPPPGYMWLRKNKLDKTTYSALYAVIGDTFNDGTQASTQFMLPDMEGRFLRAFDSAGTQDPGRVFGSTQLDDFKSHTHTLSQVMKNNFPTSIVNGSGTNNGYMDAGNSPPAPGLTGGTETRPKNIALNYIIKVTDGYKNPQLVDLAQLAVDIATIKAKGGVGLIGNVRNLRAYLATAGNLLTFTFDDVILTAGLTGAAMHTGQATRILNVGSVGIGGMDTGTSPVNGYLAVYALGNPITGDVAVIAVNATSAIAPESFQGVAQAGYSNSALLTVIPTNASGQIKPVFVKDRDIALTRTSAYTGTSTVTTTPISLAAVIPQNARAIKGEIAATSSTQSSLTMILGGDVNMMGWQSMAQTTTAFAGLANYNLALALAQTVYLTTTSSAGSPNYVIYVNGYSI